MELAHRVALNGVQLDEIDPRINIKGVEENAGKETITGTATAAGSGQRITAWRRDTLDIVVKFSMLIEYNDMPGRTELLEKVIAWAAAGGFLTLNYKPNRRVGVVLAQAPGAGDLYDWTSVYSLTFRAYTIPYWEEETARTATTGTGASGSCSMEVAGSAETVADITLRNMSGMTINNVTVNAAGKVMTFQGLSMGGSESLTISHSNGLLVLRVGNRSAMAMRTPGSADDLRVKPGVRSFSFSADRACVMTVACRGRFA